MKKRYALIPALLGGIALAVAVPLSASAHVTLNENTAKAGSYTMLTFRVPNESATATTDSIELHIPEATPFADVSYLPTPGWITKLVSTKLATPVTIGDNAITDAVTSVVWTADASSSIQDGELQEFSVFVGPVPDVDKIPLTVDQTYSDGSVVKWEDTSASAEEPAPVLYVNEAAPAATDPDAAPLTAAPASSSDTLARVIGIVGVVVGVVGVVIAIASRRRRA